MSTTYGIAKEANAVNIRVLGANGSGSTAGIVNGIEYVVNQFSGKRVISYVFCFCEFFLLLSPYYLRFLSGTRQRISCKLFVVSYFEYLLFLSCTWSETSILCVLVSTVPYLGLVHKFRDAVHVLFSTFFTPPPPPLVVTLKIKISSVFWHT